MKRSLLVITMLLLTSCSDYDLMMRSPLPVLDGLYTDSEIPDRSMLFNRTNLVVFRASADPFDRYDLQWKVGEGLFYTRMWDSEEKWKEHTYSLSGDSLTINETLYLKQQP